MRAAMLRTRARRVVARTIVSRPAYRAFIRVPASATLVARAAFRTGRDDILEHALDQLDRSRPGAAAPALLRTDLLTFQGRYAEALRSAESVARVDQRSAAATARVVRLSYRALDRGEAEQIAVEAVGRFPRSPQVMWPVAVACDNPAQYEQIKAAWSAAETDARGLLPVVRQLAVAASRAGQLDEAASWYRRAMEVLLESGGAAPRPVITRLAGLGAQHAIRDLCRALDEAGAPFFFAAGTALGLVREGRPLGADNDLDVGVFDSDFDREALIKLFTNHRLFDLDLHPQTDKIGLRHRGGAPIDVFRFYQEGGRVWHNGVFVRWHNSPFEVVRRRIGGLDLPLPADADRYLTECYGDWRSPRPAFDAFTENAPNLEVTWPDYQRVHLMRRAYESLASGDRAGAATDLRRAGEEAIMRSLGA